MQLWRQYKKRKRRPLFRLNQIPDIYNRSENLHLEGSFRNFGNILLTVNRQWLYTTTIYYRLRNHADTARPNRTAAETFSHGCHSTSHNGQQNHQRLIMMAYISEIKFRTLSLSALPHMSKYAHILQNNKIASNHHHHHHHHHHHVQRLNAVENFSPEGLDRN
jgi:hypothetical protein